MRQHAQTKMLAGMDAHTNRFLAVVLAALVCTLVAICADAGEPRTHVVRADFVTTHACQATGATPGWLTVGAHNAKVRVEPKLCPSR